MSWSTLVSGGKKETCHREFCDPDPWMKEGFRGPTSRRNERSAPSWDAFTYLHTIARAQTMNNPSSVYFIMNQVSFKKKKDMQKEGAKIQHARQGSGKWGVRSKNAPCVLFVQQCIQERALGMLAGSATLSVRHTHKHTQR